MTIPKSYEALAADLASEKILSKTLQGQKEAYMILADERKVDLNAALDREAALAGHLDAALRQVKANWDYAQDKQQRLTVAEQLLRETLPHLRFCKGMGRKFAEKLDGLDLRIEAALKSAAGCEHSFHYFGDYPRRRCNNCNALEVVAEGEGS